MKAPGPKSLNQSLIHNMQISCIVDKSYPANEGRARSNRRSLLLEQNEKIEQTSQIMKNIYSLCGSIIWYDIFLSYLIAVSSFKKLGCLEYHLTNVKKNKLGLAWMIQETQLPIYVHQDGYILTTIIVMMASIYRVFAMCLSQSWGLSFIITCNPL